MNAAPTRHPDCAAALHDTANAYRNYGCRCTSGIRAHTRSVNKWRLRRLRNGDQLLRIRATGTQRRLRALARIGYDFTWLNEQHNVDRDVSSAVASGRRTMISVDTARKVRAAYDALYAEDGPSKRAAMRAERAGWPGPWAWDDATIDNPDTKPYAYRHAGYSHVAVDPVKVENAVSGERVELTIAERRAVIVRLHRQGYNDRSIERHTGISERTALRIRGELGLPAVGGNQLAGVA